MDARPFVDAVAGMKANPLGRNPAERRVRRLDVNLRAPLLLLIVEARLDKYVRQERVVHLQQNARGDDCPVFLVQLGSERVEILFIAPVVLVDADP